MNFTIFYWCNIAWSIHKNDLYNRKLFLLTKEINIREKVAKEELNSCIYFLLLWYGAKSATKTGIFFIFSNFFSFLNFFEETQWMHTFRGSRNKKRGFLQLKDSCTGRRIYRDVQPSFTNSFYFLVLQDTKKLLLSKVFQASLIKIFPFQVSGGWFPWHSKKERCAP